MAIKKANENLKLLEEKCRMLEGQCSEYVKELEKTNQRLENEIKKHKKTEDELKRSRDDLETIVAQRTAEISQLKDRLQAENLFLKKELADSHSYGTLIGQSHSIKSVTSQIELVSPTEASVLIQGGSGTGQGTHRPGNTQTQPSKQAAVCKGQLRGDT